MIIEVDIHWDGTISGMDIALQEALLSATHGKYSKGSIILIEGADKVKEPCGDSWCYERRVVVEIADT